MSNKKLHRLKQLIKGLRKEEQTLARNHLSAYETYHTRKSSRMLRLYKVILKDPDIQYERLKKLISNESTDKSFDQLLGRTIDRIKESLILDVNILREGNYSKVFQKRFTIQKQLVQCKILNGRGLIEESIVSYNGIIRTAKKYELYDELIEALESKQSAVSTSEGIEAYERLKNEIEYYNKCRELFLEAKNTVNQYSAKVSFSSSKKTDTTLLKKTIARLDKFAEEANSLNIECLAYMLKMELYTDQHKYKLNHEVGKKFLSKVRNEPAVTSRNREGFILNKLIENQLLSLKLDSALQYSEEVMPLVKLSKNRTLFRVHENRAYIYYYKGDFDHAEKELQIMEGFSFLENEDYQRTKLYYLRAMKYFSQERFREANLLLSNMAELEKEKEGWNVWIRIMRILCSIEMLKLNLIDYDIESFRKFMQRTEKRKNIKGRDKLILKLLIELDKRSFDFEDVAKRRSKELAQLKNLSGVHKWEPLSPELVLFHDWFKAKLDDVRYEPNFDYYRQAMKDQ